MIFYHCGLNRDRDGNACAVRIGAVFEAMMFADERCSFRTVSDLEWGVTAEGDASRLLGLAREILNCRRRHECGDADCCTILGAGMLARSGRSSDP